MKPCWETAGGEVSSGGYSAEEEVEEGAVRFPSFTNQTLAQIELHQNADSYEIDVTVLPKYLDEKVAWLHLEKFGVNMTELSEEQASYIGVDVKGPYKPGHYRY